MTSDADRAALAAELRALLGLAAPPIGIAFRDAPETAGVDPVGLPHPAPTEDGRTGAGLRFLRVMDAGRGPRLLDGRGRSRQL
jgi:hypothetical protein